MQTVFEFQVFLLYVLCSEVSGFNIIQFLKSNPVMPFITCVSFWQ
jgi:hypothetical protein